MPLSFALTAYALPHVLGYLPTKDGQKHPTPLSPLGLLDTAHELDLAGVDMPLPHEIDGLALRDALAERDLKLVVESLALLDLSVEETAALFAKAATAGARVVRFTLSSILCGDRRPLGPGGWLARREALAIRLREVLPIAAENNLVVALENHQDATTDDFFWLFERSGQHPAFGVCLDAGNPLAVGEAPVEAARRLAPLIRHVHCKDYTIHFAPDGYRLVRCAAGTGVVDFPSILALCRGNGFDALLPGIEIAAQATRTIPFLDDGWWAEHDPRDARALLGALRILWAKGRPQDEPYSSAWERGEDSATVSAEEWRLVRESVAYFATLSPSKDLSFSQ